MEQLLIFWGSFFALGLVFTVWERRAPARTVHYRARLLRDCGAFFTFLAFTFGAGILIQLTLPLVMSPVLMASVAQTGVLGWPIWLRLLLFYILWDLGLYAVHWIMHTAPVWRVHKWHHSPEDVWWFVGVRSSFLQLLITQVPFFWFWILGLPPWMAALVSIHAVLNNAWTHVNVSAPWMAVVELVFTTPRFHAIHHSERPEHYCRNLGSFFTLWDRVFQTYVDPSLVETKGLRFGTGERLNPIRLAAGV